MHASTTDAAPASRAANVVRDTAADGGTSAKHTSAMLQRYIETCSYFDYGDGDFGSIESDDVTCADSADGDADGGVDGGGSGNGVVVGDDCRCSSVDADTGASSTTEAPFINVPACLRPYIVQCTYVNIDDDVDDAAANTAAAAAPDADGRKAIVRGSCGPQPSSAETPASADAAFRASFGPNGHKTSEHRGHGKDRDHPSVSTTSSIPSFSAWARAGAAWRYTSTIADGTRCCYVHARRSRRHCGSATHSGRSGACPLCSCAAVERLAIRRRPSSAAEKALVAHFQRYVAAACRAAHPCARCR